MLVLDLKLLLFLILLALMGSAGLVWLWARQRVDRRNAGPAGLLLPTLADVPLLTLLDAAPCGLLLLDGAQVLYTNRYARRLLHLPETAGPLPDSDWLPLLDADRAVVRRAGGDLVQYRNVTFATGQTARWWVMSWRPEDDGEPCDAVFLLDITGQQRTEQVGRALLNDLAHELRTPIATILTHLEILGLDDVGEDVRTQSLSLAQDEAQRMARLLQDMLELGRLETSSEMPRRPVDLVTLVEEVVLQSTPRAAECHMALSLEASSPLPLVDGNADRLRQVFLNLLDNAFKYARLEDRARSENRVTVVLRRAEGSSGNPPRDGVACAVCDTGPGIPPEHLPYVTRRFYRAAPKSIAGSGLGLSLVAEILRRHESSLEIESPTADGMGTCVRFVLPQVPIAQDREDLAS